MDRLTIVQQEKEVGTGGRREAGGGGGKRGRGGYNQRSTNRILCSLEWREI